MHQGGRALRRNALQQLIVHAIDCRKITRFLRVPLSVPTLELALNVTLVLAKVIQANINKVGGVNRCHGVDK